MLFSAAFQKAAGLKNPKSNYGGVSFPYGKRLFLLLNQSQ
jgi:hypothetical protein